MRFLVYFFFQAEDGIRDGHVTGVQTCALPISELARRVIEQIMARRPPAGTLFNVNIPSLDKGPVKGIRVTPQNVAPYREKFDRRVDPRGRVYFWTTPGLICPDPHPDSDVTALDEGYITVT